jgi:putative ABC transport system permease protein
MTQPAPGDGRRRERRIWGPDLRRDVDDEIAFHLEQRQRDLSAGGLSDRDAKEEARRRFGNVAEVAAVCRGIDEQWHREQRRASMWSALRQDGGYAVRTLIKNRGFAATAILTLALGIGANTAIFSIINGVLFRPQPFREPARIVFLWSTSDAFPREPLTPGRLIDFREQMSSLSAVAGISHIPLNLTGAGEPERLSGSSVSSSFFDVLGAPALLGEPFHTGRADDRDVVLSHKVWMRLFAGDRGMVGRQITLNGTARTVVAVMPPDFGWPMVTASGGSFDGPDLWIPGTTRDVPRTPTEQPDIASNRRAGYVRAVARLKDGVSIDRARQEAQAIAVRLAQQYPNEDGGRGATLVPLNDQFFGSLQQPMIVLLGAVGLVLAIACANIASLLLGRGAARRKELAVRLALGASRARVIRQLMTESIVLALASAGVGMLAAWWSLQWLARLGPGSLPGIERLSLDGRVLGLTLLLSVVTGILCGLVPALHASVSTINADLNEGGGRSSEGRRSTRTRDVFVAVEIAVALVLLVGAGLLLRSFHSLSQVDTGIRTSNLLTFNMFLSGERAGQQRLQRAFYDAALTEIAAVPGVQSVGAAVTLPIGGDDFAAPVSIEGQPLAPPGDEPRAGFQVITPGYFGTMGIRVVGGRDFTASDIATAPPVVMVNETFARQHWAGLDPIGRRMRVGRGGRDTAGWLTVVGLVSDIRHKGPATPPRPEFYQPHTQYSFSFMAFVVRTHGTPAALVPSIRQAIARLDPSQPISDVKTMDEHVATALSRPRLLSTLVAAFGALALILSVVGVYGVMAFSVTQRTREIAIRAALGATSTSVLTLVLKKALWLALAGVAAGLAASTGLSRALRGLLFGITAADAATYVAVIVTLTGVALLAAALPAWRATRIPGAQVLR